MDGNGDLPIRIKVNEAYERVMTSVFGSLEQLAKMERAETQANEDKGQLNYHVIMIGKTLLIMERFLLIWLQKTFTTLSRMFLRSSQRRWLAFCNVPSHSTKRTCRCTSSSCYGAPLLDSSYVCSTLINWRDILIILPRTFSMALIACFKVPLPTKCRFIILTVVRLLKRYSRTMEPRI